MKSNKKFISVIGIIGVMFLSSGVLAYRNIDFSQSIDGSLGVGVVDANGNGVSSASIEFSTISFSLQAQTTTATLGTSNQRIRMSNPFTSRAWTLSIAATDGKTAKWQGSSGAQYDYNDSASNANDGSSDADSIGGQMTINPTTGTINGVGSTSTTGVSKGNVESFIEGTNDSIDLMSGSSSAQAPGQWDLTGVSVSQTIPASQAAEDYLMEMTLTAS